MHYKAQKLMNNENSTSYIGDFLKKGNIDEKDVFNFIDIMEKEIGEENTFDIQYFQEARSYLMDVKHGYIKTYEEYRKFNYYLDKLKWLKLKNIKIYYHDEMAKLDDKIFSRCSDVNVRNDIRSFGLLHQNYMGLLDEIYQEALLDVLKDIDIK
ncbi:MAG: hypothetical protein JJT76_17525 [Clostridiaceae bacterium]|nr:hypothetical protein [Clostridiaceae bacterium]